MEQIRESEEQKSNSHVSRLHRYLPFTPIMDQIFEEYTSTTDSLNLETRAHKYLHGAVENGAKIVVLTGDAGHGKTHLCRKLIESYLSYDEAEARALINTACDGNERIVAKDGSPKASLWIYKDFSELPIDRAASEIEKAGSREEGTTIICANEGRLRAVLESESSGAKCAKLLNDFAETFNVGLASRDGKDHIINLNYQTVASPGGSLVDRTFKEWLSGTRWSVCQKCSSCSGCPIYRNRSLLSPQVDHKAEGRRRKLEAVFATVERLDAVVTIREMLMTVAYLITGGLTCSNVHERLRRKSHGWQPEFAFYNLLFQSPDKNLVEKLQHIPVLQAIARIDPGTRAIRSVDERLINQQGQFPEGEIDIVFEIFNAGRNQTIDASNGIDDVIGNPRNRNERKREAQNVEKIVRSLRRRSFFEDELDEVETMKRLGFPNGGDFLEILRGDELQPARMATLKGKLIAGLHMLQGLRLGARETYLYLVDPAFGNATSHAAIISRRISLPLVKLIPMADKWELAKEHPERAMSNAVDWLERHVVIRIKLDEGDYEDFALDLMMFDCAAQASGGYVPEEFFAHDIRKVTNFFGRIAEKTGGSDQEISLFLSGRMHSVAIDNGVIQVGGGN